MLRGGRPRGHADTFRAGQDKGPSWGMKHPAMSWHRAQERVKGPCEARVPEYPGDALEAGVLERLLPHDSMQSSTAMCWEHWGPGAGARACVDGREYVRQELRNSTGVKARQV